MCKQQRQEAKTALHTTGHVWNSGDGESSVNVVSEMLVSLRLPCATAVVVMVMVTVVVVKEEEEDEEKAFGD